MIRRFTGLRVSVIAGAAITMGMMFVPPSQAASVARPAPGPAVYQAPLLQPNELIGKWKNGFNKECLDGRLGVGNVTLQPCGQDGDHEIWENFFDSNTNDWTIQNKFNSYCLDGRLGTGNVTLQPCGSDGTHQAWQEFPYGVAGVFLLNVFNQWALDGRLGVGNVTMQGNNDGTHMEWTLTDLQP